MALCPLPRLSPAGTVPGCPASSPSAPRPLSPAEPERLQEPALGPGAPYTHANPLPSSLTSLCLGTLRPTAPGRKSLPELTPSSSGGRARRGEVTGFLSVAGQASGDSHSSSITGQDRPPKPPLGMRQSSPLLLRRAATSQQSGRLSCLERGVLPWTVSQDGPPGPAPRIITPRTGPRDPRLSPGLAPPA